MHIQIEENRLFALGVDGTLVAELLFPATGESTVCITHTFVDDTLRGQRAAGQLLETAVATLRSTGRRATATCSYAQAWLAKHPDTQDIQA